MGIETAYQTALWALLDANKATLGVTGIYDSKPQDDDAGAASVFPYMLIGDIFLTQLDTRGTNGWTAAVRIHTVTRQHGRKEAKTIQGRLYDLLHDQPLTIAGFNEFVLQRQNSFTQTQADNNVRGTCEFDGLVEVSS